MSDTVLTDVELFLVITLNFFHRLLEQHDYCVRTSWQTL